MSSTDQFNDDETAADGYTFNDVDPNDMGLGEDPQPHETIPWFESSAKFVEGFTPPDYLIDGLIVRRYIYSLTGQTGSGKTACALRIVYHVATGTHLNDETACEKGRVLFFAGENPDDVRMRWIALCERMGKAPADVDVFFLPAVLDIKALRKQIDAEAEVNGPFSLVIVDTSAAYFRGDDENNNVQALAHARTLRALTELPGGPAVIVTCHPTKGATDNLLPRGGGSYLNEVDGNLTCAKVSDNMSMIHWQGKIRGPDFSPVHFKIEAVQSDKLVDSKNKKLWTVVATPLDDLQHAELAQANRCDEDDVIAFIADKPGASMAEIAEGIGWYDTKGFAKKSKVQRIITKLVSNGYVAKDTSNGAKLTTAGGKHAEGLSGASGVAKGAERTGGRPSFGDRGAEMGPSRARRSRKAGGEDLA